MPKAIDLIDESASLRTLIAPADARVESVTVAWVVPVISLRLSDSPSATAAEVACDLEIDTAAEPLTASIQELSLALTRMSLLALDPLRVVTVELLRTLDWVWLRIRFTPIEPATLTANAVPVVELATPPEAPIPTAKMLAAISASTLMLPAVEMFELLTSATTRLPVPSPSSWLTEKDPPIATAPPWPCPTALPIPIATAPAPAMIFAVFWALTTTFP